MRLADWFYQDRGPGGRRIGDMRALQMLKGLYVRIAEIVS